MIINLKNKHTLQIDEFQFRCCIGKNGITKKKIEGDNCTPKGLFKLSQIYYRADRISLGKCKIKKTKISKNMGWCDDSLSKFYNKQININKKVKHEKLYRRDYKYDYVIALDYNRKKIITKKGSAIFIHLTKDYKPTAGCVAINRLHFEILLKIIKKNTFIRIN
ncbi:L,D-transpeptidase family protein [Candidatus Pelagibacter sp. Uisw_090]|uniref:L,D-transpeptidase family protein n=1 Tax=Candidatus Pelagibacter sp. Uisw_090 TaxID=3230993 RepID=UPI0039E937A3